MAGDDDGRKEPGGASAPIGAAPAGDIATGRGSVAGGPSDEPERPSPDRAPMHARRLALPDGRELLLYSFAEGDGRP